MYIYIYMCVYVCVCTCRVSPNPSIMHYVTSAAFEILPSTSGYPSFLASFGFRRNTSRRETIFKV